MKSGVSREDFITVAEAARILKCSKIWIWRLIARGELPAMREPKFQGYALVLRSFVERRANVIDKKKNVCIRITQEDIKRGKRDSANKCPVALAVCRTMGCDQDQITVYEPYACCIEGPGWSAHFSYRMANWISEFDRGKRASPVRFMMTLDWISDVVTS
jgi:hypothetical protein